MLSKKSTKNSNNSKKLLKIVIKAKMKVAYAQVSPKNALIHQMECNRVMLRELNCSEDLVGANILVNFIKETPTIVKCVDNIVQVSSKIDEKRRNICTFNLNRMNDSDRYEFLQKIIFFRTSPDDFCLDTPPKSISITMPYITKNQLWLMRHFPQLERVEFRSIDNLVNGVLIRFFSLNPQLKHVEIDNCAGMTSSFLMVFAQYARNLTHLRISKYDFFKHDRGFSSYPNYQRYVLEPLGHLRKLKFLEMEDTSKFIVETMINVLANGNVPIEHLAFSPGNSNHACEYMQTIHTLKYLRLKGRYSVRKFDDLVRSQFNVKKFDLNFHVMDIELFPVATDFMEHILERQMSKDLCKLSFDVTCYKYGYIEEDTYYTLLEYAKYAVENVRIDVYKGRVTVPANVIKKNRDLIYIAYKETNHIQS